MTKYDSRHIKHIRIKDADNTGGFFKIKRETINTFKPIEFNEFMDYINLVVNSFTNVMHKIDPKKVNNLDLFFDRLRKEK